MTREETKARFKHWCQVTIGNHCSNEDEQMFNNIMALLEQEPCGDLISKQAVIDVLTKNRVHFVDMVKITSELKDLPSVNPQKSCDTCKHSDETDGSNCYECVKGMKDNYDSQEPCGDTINRQHIIDTYKSCADMFSDDELKGADTVMEWVYNEPPVNPQEPIDIATAIKTMTNVKALGEEIRIMQKAIKNKKVLIGFNLAVALCNKYLGEGEGV